MSYFQILNINPLSSVSFVNSLSHSVGWNFDHFFCCAKAFNFNWISFVYFCLFFLLALGNKPTKYCYIFVKKCFAYILFWEFYDFRSYIQVFNVLSLFFILYEVNVLITSFYMQFSNFPSTIYQRDCLPTTVFSCFLCHTLLDHSCVGLFLSSLFYSVDLCVCFCASTMMF